MMFEGCHYCNGSGGADGAVNIRSAMWVTSRRRTGYNVVRMRVAAVLLLCTLASAQDLVSIAPKNAKVEYEDVRVLVVRLKLAPNESLPMHDRPARVVIAVTANDVDVTAPDGSTRSVKVPAGNI